MDKSTHEPTNKFIQVFQKGIPRLSKTNQDNSAFRGGLIKRTPDIRTLKRMDKATCELFVTGKQGTDRTH